MDNTNDNDTSDNSTNDELKDVLKKFLARSQPLPPEKGYYYTQAYGTKVKEMVDSVLSTKTPYVIVAKGASVNTLRTQYYQGAQYLRDHLDTPDKFYDNALQYITCRRFAKHIEVALRARGSILDLPSALRVDWRERVREFLDTEQPIGAKLTITPIALTEEDIKWATEQFIGVEDFYLYTIAHDQLLIIRYDKSAG